MGRSFRQARFGGKTMECPLVGSKGDTLMVNHGLITSANMSKVTFGLATSSQVNLWVIRSMQKVTFI